MPMMPPERKKAAVYISLIFLCGFLTGTAMSNLWMHWGAASVSAQGESKQMKSRERVVEKFTKRLSLSADQASQLNVILDETRRGYREHETEIEIIRQQGRNRIREILTPEQRDKYEEMLVKTDRKKNRHP